jgi:hypothetical protein
LVHAGKHDEGKSSFRMFRRDFPELTIAEVRSGLPYTATLLDRVADGLENSWHALLVIKEERG